jgi:O-antigen chain-terminating methyltransferase
VDTDELTAILQEVHDRVRARHPDAVTAGELPLPDLMPLLHARDAAEAKVAAIGTVNPRAGGPFNWLAQQAKKAIARALEWHIREQVEFNRNVMACVQATLEALEENRRVLAAMDRQWRQVTGEQRGEVQELKEVLRGEIHQLKVKSETEVQELAAHVRGEVQELKDIRVHWAEWRQGWEHKLVVNETKLLRGLAELNAAFQHRTGQNESFFRDQIKLQHADFEAALDRYGVDIQKRLWADMERIRKDYDHLIHSELRLIRQRVATSPPAAAAPPSPPPQSPSPAQPEFDYARFAERFRGSEEYVKKGQQFYLPYFTGRREVLDVGCGRGEFLELMREAGVAAHGIDLSRESVDLCRQKGFEAEAADLFPYLADLPEASLDGIFSAQVVEHLPPERLPEMIRLAASRLERDGVLAIETPNPECLAIFASHFYLDPTHTRPVPHALLAFYMEEYGLGGIEVHRLSPAIESMPALAGLPEDFREAFFGGLDYAIIGRKL